MSAQAIAEQIPRDRWGRPLIPPPGGGKPVAYTRVSTLAKTLDDTEGLSRWKQRQVLHGITLRPDLLALARSANGDKQRLDQVAKQAMEAAASAASANVGTALHSWVEMVDGGMVTVDAVPAEQRADIVAYTTAIAEAGLLPVLSEQFVVCDDIQAAGTLDVAYLHTPTGRLLPADVKSGHSAADYPQAVAIQVATYAHGVPYTHGEGRQAPLGTDTATGVLVHLPQGTGTCRVYALDLEQGWAAAKEAAWVRQWRRTKPISAWGLVGTVNSGRRTA